MHELARAMHGCKSEEEIFMSRKVPKSLILVNGQYFVLCHSTFFTLARMQIEVGFSEDISGMKITTDHFILPWASNNSYFLCVIKPPALLFIPARLPVSMRGRHAARRRSVFTSRIRKWGTQNTVRSTTTTEERQRDRGIDFRLIFSAVGRDPFMFHHSKHKRRGGHLRSLKSQFDERKESKMRWLWVSSLAINMYGCLLKLIMVTYY